MTRCWLLAAAQRFEPTGGFLPSVLSQHQSRAISCCYLLPPPLVSEMNRFIAVTDSLLLFIVCCLSPSVSSVLLRVSCFYDRHIQQLGLSIYPHWVLQMSSGMVSSSVEVILEFGVLLFRIALALQHDVRICKGQMKWRIEKEDKLSSSTVSTTVVSIV